MMGTHHIPEDQASSSSTVDTNTIFSASPSSSGPSRTHILGLRDLLSRSKSLPHKLWDASLSASGPDFTSLADAVHHLSTVSSQVVRSLSKSSQGVVPLASQQVWSDAVEVAQQCIVVFNHIEELLGTEDSGTAIESVDSWEKDNESSIFGGDPGQREVHIVGSLLKGMTLSIEVIGQVLSLAENMIAEKNNPTTDTACAKEDAREIAQNAIIQQQLALLKAVKSVRRLQTRFGSMMESQMSQSPRSVPINEVAADDSPSIVLISLAKFQESNMLPMLIPSISASSKEGERKHVTLIKSAASARVEESLTRWTNVEVIMRSIPTVSSFPNESVPRMNNMGNMNTSAPRRSLRLSTFPEETETMRLRRLSQQPSIEDEEHDRTPQIINQRETRESFFAVKTPIFEASDEQKHQRVRTSNPIPIRSHSNASGIALPHPRAPEMLRNNSSPATVPPFHQDSIFRPAALSSSQSSTYQNAYSSSVPLPSRQSIGYSYPKVPQTQQQQSARYPPQFETASVTSTSSTLSSCHEIPWRRRLEASRWDFHDEILVQTNTTMSSDHALKDHRTLTEMREDWILPQALQEMNLDYTIERGDAKARGSTRGKRTVRIKKGLSWEEVQRIVARSAELLDERRVDEESRERDLEWDHGGRLGNAALIRRDSGRGEPSRRRDSAGSGEKERNKRRVSMIIPSWAPTESDLRDGYRSANVRRSSRSERERRGRDRDWERERNRDRDGACNDVRRDVRFTQSQTQPQIQYDCNPSHPRLERQPSTSSQQTAYRDGEKGGRDERERLRNKDRGRERRDSGYSQAQKYIPEEDDDGYSTDKTPRARSSSRNKRSSRSKSLSKRNDDHYDEKNRKDKRDDGDDARRGNFMDFAKEAGKIAIPAAGIATLVVKGLGVL